MAQLLARSPDLSDEQRENVNMILAAADNLVEIINDILDISRIEAGRMEMNTATMDLRAMARELVAMHAVSAEKKGITVKLNLEDAPQWVIADPVRLRQVLVNLLGNAVKFTEKGAVTLTVADRGHGWSIGTRHVEFIVEDTGPGIEEEDRERIFFPFTQGRPDAHSPTGSGLGLAIANRLLALMGSKIEMQSTPGRGSRFHFTLDLHVTEPKNDGEKTMTATTPPKRDLRILIAEDMHMNRLLLQKSLAAMGITAVDCAANGKEALEKVAEKEYDYILMDIRMPVMDGLTATREMREAGVTTPIIALTAQAMEEDKEQCAAAGMNAYLAKPYRLNDLKRLLDEDHTEFN
ncbi:response regulator [Salidesulfovibrio brasiliensis]|uniref:response regulator n=1 Tax=Salidesulfovibrio brasiliensis TaxID=221711 RepID=UPI0006D21B55|nr:response regulator [Salidesulfovibrio brasiliensis]